MTSQVRAVIFDFDLTLVDSSAGFVAAHGFAAAECGLPAPDEDAIRRTIGIGIEAVPVILYGAAGTAVAARYIRAYQAKSDEVMGPLTRVLSPARPALAALQAQGLKLAIVSQKLRRRVVEVLDREGLTGNFAAIIGGDQVSAYKPDPEGILAAIATAKAEAAIYVGDTTIDAEAARYAGVPFVGVLSGVTTRAEMEAYAHAAILADVGGVPAFCETWHW